MKIDRAHAKRYQEQYKRVMYRDFTNVNSGCCSPLILLAKRSEAFFLAYLERYHPLHCRERCVYMGELWPRRRATIGLLSIEVMKSGQHLIAITSSFVMLLTTIVGHSKIGRGCVSLASERVNRELLVSGTIRSPLDVMRPSITLLYPAPLDSHSRC